MFVEHVLGIRIDALTRTIRWNRPGPAAGIRRLRCGPTTVDLSDDGEGTVTVTVDAPLRVVVDGNVTDVAVGTTRLVA